MRETKNIAEIIMKENQWKIKFYLLFWLVVIAVSGCSYEKKADVPQTLSNVSVITASVPLPKFPAGSKYAFVKFASESDLDGEAAMIARGFKRRCLLI